MFKSDRFIFRRFRVEDLDELHKMEGDQEVMKFTGPGRAQSFAESEIRLKKVLEHIPESEVMGFWAPIERETNKLIGWFMLVKTKENIPELGFMIAKEYWGKGYATELSKYLCNQAITEFGIDKIIARTDRNNHASIKVLEKVGFKLSGEDKKGYRFLLESKK